MKENKLWFRAKYYGWGWYPATWQGWLVLLVWLATIISFTFIFENFINSTNGIFYFETFIISSVIILIYICYKKGEKPRWQWGKEKKK